MSNIIIITFRNNVLSDLYDSGDTGEQRCDRTVSRVLLEEC